MTASEIESVKRATSFVDTVVHNVVATPVEIMAIVRASGAVVQLRGASSFATDYIELEPDQRDAAMII